MLTKSSQSINDPAFYGRIAFRSILTFFGGGFSKADFDFIGFLNVSVCGEGSRRKK